MVRPDHCDYAGIPMFLDWGDTASRFAYFLPTELGIVLHSYGPIGGNGCKVVLSSGKVGWCNLYYLVPVNEQIGGG